MDDESQRGRPSKYEDKFCAELIEHMAQGLSFESFGGVAHVSKQTLFTWADVHPEFLDAKERGTELGRLFWEKKGIEGLFNETEYNDKGKPVKSKAINSSIFSQYMKNRFGWKNTGGSEVVVNNYAAKKDEELDAKLREYGINPDTLKPDDTTEGSE